MDLPSVHEVNPSHTFTTTTVGITTFAVRLTVQDAGGLSSEHEVQVILNNTPPRISSTSLDGLSNISTSIPTSITLNAVVDDDEHDVGTLNYEWHLGLFHNDHYHPEPPVFSPQTTTVLSPLGCDGATLWYRVTLQVTDPEGLAATYTKDLYPDCVGITQELDFPAIPDQVLSSAAVSVPVFASSGLPVTLYVVDGPGVVTGGQVQFTTPGRVTVRAVQNGNQVYTPAHPVERTFRVVPDGPAGFDAGDAPSQYGFATHRITTGLYLGACVDGGTDVQDDGAAEWDDVNASPIFAGTPGSGDDEDGVLFPEGESFFEGRTRELVSK